MKIAYQKTGEYHLKNGLQNQDVVLCAESKKAKIIVIADGASSCENSKRGAELACGAISDIMLNETEYFFTSTKEKIAGLLITYVYRKLLMESKTKNETVESYSSTLSFVCFNKISGEIMTFVLGNSLIYSIQNGNMALFCNPKLFNDFKTYTTTTKGAASAAEIKIIPSAKKFQFLLATDGAWKTFYKNGVLSEKVECAVMDGSIIGYLEKQQCKDDCSIVMMDIPKGA